MGFQGIFNSTDGFVINNVVLYSKCARSGLDTCALATSSQIHCGYSLHDEIIMDKIDYFNFPSIDLHVTRIRPSIFYWK